MLAACGLLLLAGCADSPKDVTKKYYQALAEGDLEAANSYSTSKTHAVNALFVGLSGDKKDEMKKQMEEGLSKLDNCREEINGDTAKIYMGDDEEASIILQKVDGDWKVDAQK